MMIDPVISWSASLFTGGLFLAAALHKLADFRRFRATVRAYRIVADDLSGPLAIMAVVAELVSGSLAIAIGTSSHRAGLAGCVGLLAVYGALILFSIARGNSAIDCGCLGFAAWRPRLSNVMVARNLILVAVAAVAMAPVSDRPLLWLDYGAMTATLVMLALLYAGFDLAINLPKKEELL